MKWLTELRREAAMNHSFEFIVVKRNRVPRSYRLNTVQQASCDGVFNRVVELSLRAAIGGQSHGGVKRWMWFQSRAPREKISSQSFIQQ
jgi:hypothetical protein